ncbi:unnamed protein product [Strongylus vulgaris]|uniref:Peptidase M13 N-terminal domain-containing protein n=1 Tax=Strongylus vulgaris TaxID=40348 RepID=A0A3P7K9R9_STRVU|nr:unnamed protein product [Strongylus vulgaris]
MPLVDWPRYYHAIAPFPTHEYLSSSPDLIVEIDFMRRITDLLQSTDPRIITNYVLLRYSSSWSGEMGERYEDISQEFNRIMYGKQQKAPRWKDCTSQTMHRLHYATGAIYVRKAFDQASKNVTLEMIDDLQEVFREILLTTDWMDERTRTVS